MFFKDKPENSIFQKKRFKHFSLKKLFKISCFLIFVISAIIFFQLLYTPWLLSRTYEPETKSLEKNWLANPWSAIRVILPDFLEQNYAAIINVLFAEEVKKSSSIPTLSLFVRNNGLEELDIKNFQYQMGAFSKKPRINGYLENDYGQPIPVRLNIRGMMQDHHQAWKPSLRINFNKNQLYSGFRNHKLVAPNDGIGFRNWLSNALSAYWNMLGTGEHFVRLFINGKYFGVYNRLWRLDESLLIDSNRLPGPFFRLEVQVKRLFYVGNFLTWDKVGAWEIKGAPYDEGQGILWRPLSSAYDAIRWTLSDGRKKLLEKIININEWIDNDVFAKYQALLTHSGERHVDGMHNNAFWLDQTTGKLVPILIDLDGYLGNIGDWGNLDRPVIKAGSAFVDFWLKHPLNYLNYVDRLWEVLTTFGSLDSVETIIRKKYSEIREDIRSDVYLSLGGNPRKFFPVTQTDQLINNLIEFVAKRNEWLISRLTSDQLSIVAIKNDRFRIFVEGFAGVIGQRRDGKTFRIKGRATPVEQFSFLPHVNLLVNQIDEFPTVYGFYEVFGKPEDFIFSHRFSKKEVLLKDFKRQDILKILETVEGFNQFSIPAIDKTPVRLGPGEIRFKNTKEFNIGQPVSINPRTTIYLDSGVSLIFRGPLTIDGTKNEPVHIKPLDPNRPFGVVALIGEESRESAINYLNMEGGSIGNRFNLKFSGMLSIHDCPDVKILNSRFANNVIGDDAVHIVRSTATIEDSVFENAYSDALDWDKVDGVIKNSRFTNSVNDAIDLSMGNIEITGNHFRRCGDKCISAGEGSKTLVSNVRIMDCNIGIAVKDKSQLDLRDSVFDGCHIAWSSYRKKWRWEEGGKGSIRNTRFLNSTEADISGDKLSQLNFPEAIPHDLKIKGKIKIQTLPNYF